MKLLRWFQREVGLWTPFREIKRPKFPVCDELEARARAIRIQKRLGDPKPVRYVEDQDDFGSRRPVNFDEMPIG